MQSGNEANEKMDKQLKRFGNAPQQNFGSSTPSNSRANTAPLNPVTSARSVQNIASGSRRGAHFSGADIGTSGSSRNAISTRGVGGRAQGLNTSKEFGLNGAEFGSRKHNFNQLLNLNYGHRGDMGANGSRSGGHQSFQKRYSYYQPKYNKEQFLQANCQFIVKECGEYAVHHVDPDVLVEWKNIEQVKVYSHEEPSCPICLHFPVAGKMTRCGHVYCWPCILHYLSLTDEKWRKCPICYESVYAADLKSVAMETVQPIKVGMDITMRLMVCEKNSAWPFPVDEWMDRRGLFYNVRDQQILDYSKIVLIRPDQIQKEILTREERELLTAMELETDDLEVGFIQAALKALTDRHSSAADSVNGKKPSVTRLPQAETYESLKNSQPSKSKKAYECAFSEVEKEIQRVETSSTSDEKSFGDVLDSTPSSSVSVDSILSPEAEEFVPVLEDPKISRRPLNMAYFYQAADAQHVYLHPLNFRMLIAQYGELRNAPTEFTARVLEVENFTVTEDIRKRYRYLSHLPLTCVFNMVELELKPPYISEEVMHSFDKEVQQREFNRQTKSRKETTRQHEAENAFRKDIRGRMTYSFQTEQFPSVGASSSASLDLDSAEAFPAVGGSDMSPPVWNPLRAAASEPKSFAKMLREGKVQPQSASSSLSSREQLSVRRDSDSHDEGDEEYQRARDFKATFSAGLDAAFDRFELEENKSAQSTSTAEKGNGSKNSKKKRPKNTVLFTTGGMPPRV